MTAGAALLPCRDFGSDYRRVVLARVDDALADQSAFRESAPGRLDGVFVCDYGASLRVGTRSLLGTLG